ncbi:flippase [Dendronalium sp. ChiSLP03b]|uniref:flippase n=1 Tax=Dendronalium sp. ChiSLP03b TaxID=3075381 RepID=UPI002AD40F79|nr:flippase [Dendronalium sp. ChiSLP03b]MDZ8206110.1 flippase [Dendronalium sp. ChiSLP03b]
MSKRSKLGSKLVGNSFALLVNRLTQSITTFVLVASIARILGPYELGQYMLAFSYYFVFMSIASQGFKTLFTRELARNPHETPLYLVSGSLLQLLFGIIGYAVLAVLVFALPYSPDTSTVCYVMGLTIIPFSLSNITEAIFQAQEKMHLIAISTVPVYILRLLLMIWGMNLKYDINFVCALMVISETLILLIEWGLISRFVKYKFQFDWNFMWKSTKDVGTFIVIEGISVLKDRMQVLILSLLGGEIVVGLYGAVGQLMQPFQIISYSLIIGLFPSMSKAVSLGREQQQKLAERAAEILLIVVLPFIIGIFFIGQDLLILLYKDGNFAQAALALNIIAIGLLTSAFSRPLSYVLVANGFERVNLIEVLTTTVLGALLSILLVPKYQLNGAAFSVLITQIISCTIYIYNVYKRLFYLNLWHTTRRPILVSFLMVTIFVGLHNFSQNILVTMLSATLAYTLITSILGVYAVGGFSVVWEKISHKLHSIKQR